jgi:hypothetical protein
MSAVCPSCGVAVVPGYAKCPKCQTPLPYGRGSRRVSTVAGGTAVDDRRFPIVAIAAPLGIVLLIVLVKVCSGGSEESAKPETTTITPPPTPGPTVAQPQTPTGPPQNPTTPTQPVAADRAAASAELDRVLRLKRFWSTIDVSGVQVDVRSASCDDPARPGVIDGVAPVLRGAGLTRLRCLAQSGTIVFERSL